MALTDAERRVCEAIADRQEELVSLARALIARRPGRGDGRSLFFGGHIDVVSPEPRASWTSDPFAGRGPRRQALRARRL